MDRLYDALETCLNEIERGAEMDAALARYPDLADELRPLLELSIKTKKMAAPPPPQDTVIRTRAKVLQRAAQMRETNTTRALSFPKPALLRRFAFILTIVITIFLSGTSLVRAASSTLPGDNLYPLKRTWENLTLFFTFDVQKREALEYEHENERLEELYELFARGRVAKVDFSGYVTHQDGTRWLVSGIPVVISAQTRLPDEPILIGAAVRVRGQTQDTGFVLAERIELLPPNAVLPKILEEEKHEEEEIEIEDEAGKGSEGGGPRVRPTKTPKVESLEGVITSMNGSIWTISNALVDVSLAVIEGTPRLGVQAKATGYFAANGIFIAAKIEIEENGSEGSDSGSSGDGDDHGNDDDSNNDENNDDDENNNNDDNGNMNDNENGNDNDNENNNDNGNSNSNGNDNDDEDDNDNDDEDDDNDKY
ncbi:MAG TPA: DUF5667 domain-containing protein [Anaerolineales bacterium]|nr:DUF5667 domain-containing protein [Anaerolineales bacterium]